LTREAYYLFFLGSILVIPELFMNGLAGGDVGGRCIITGRMSTG
jgi:hypothetical protein